jgi:hypothetical protein
MQFIKTAFWVIIAVAIALFSKANWEAAVPVMPGRVAVKLWGDIIIEPRLPVLIISAYLLGLLPMWIISRANRWRWRRRLDSVERALSSALVHTHATVASASPAAEESTPSSSTGTPQ